MVIEDEWNSYIAYFFLNKQSNKMGKKISISNSSKKILRTFSKKMTRSSAHLDA